MIAGHYLIVRKYQADSGRLLRGARPVRNVQRQITQRQLMNRLFNHRGEHTMFSPIIKYKGVFTGV